MKKLLLIKTISDKRGKIFFYKSDKKTIHMVETLKGFSRGGHYHPYDSKHILISGKIKFKEFFKEKKIEKIYIYNAPSIIVVKKNVPHLLTAINDCIFIEIFDSDYVAKDFSKYRNFVLKKL